MTRNDLTVIGYKHWVRKTKALDALGDLAHLLLRMGAGIPGVGLQRGDKAFNQVGAMLRHFG
jgi:hypothetical protein